MVPKGAEITATFALTRALLSQRAGGGGGGLATACTAWALRGHLKLEPSLYTRLHHDLPSAQEKRTKAQFIDVIIFFGGILICLQPMILVCLESRGRLELGSRYFRWTLHCARTVCKGVPLLPDNQNNDPG